MIATESNENIEVEFNASFVVIVGMISALLGSFTTVTLLYFYGYVML